MNPESDPALRQHAVLLYDEEVAEVILGFEDLPRTWGDNDFNDWVIRERLRTVYDANGLVSGCILDGFIAARGAANSNEFALRLVDIEGAQIESATLNINGNSYQKSVENNQTDAVVSLWSNSQTYTQTRETGKCSLFNTNKQCAQFDPVPFSFDVKFTNSQLSLNHSALDFFIYRTSDRTLEIHMPEYAPTDWFNFARFGTKNDTSDPSQQRYFKSANNLPWAIKATDDWHYPREYIDVLWAYPDYEQWVETSGSQSADWYKTSERIAYFYQTE